MIDYKNALEVLFEHEGSFTSFKNEAVDFSRDSFKLTLQSTDSFYVGFYKPISKVYFDIVSGNTNYSKLNVSFWNGSAYTPVTTLTDSTSGFVRNGFVSWDKNQVSEQLSVVNSASYFWYKFTVDAPTSEVEFNAANILFSDDQALELKFSKALEDEFLDGDRNHCKVHASVRDEIVETLNRKGYLKYNSNKISSSGVSYSPLTPWDLHDIFEVKEAATYLALSRIFFDFSDRPDDIWMLKSQKYENLYKENMDVANISLDLADDGIVTNSESNIPTKTRYISR